MLNRILLVADALLIVALVSLGVRFCAVWTAPAGPPADRPAAAGPVAGAGPTAPPPSPHPPLSAFSEIATKNLFNPLRTEETPAPAKAPEKAPATAPALPRPRLYGVVLGAEGAARAFLEDPRTRKVARYAVGDSVADSRLEEIKPDRVVLSRGGEAFEVLLRDPSKPRPAPAAAPALPAFPGAPGSAPVGAATPGSATRGRPAVSPGVAGPPAGGGQGMPASPGFLPTQPAAPPPGGWPAPGFPGVPVDPGIAPTS